MGEEKPKKVDSETTSQEMYSPVKEEKASNEVTSDKSLFPLSDKKVSHSKSPATVEKVPDGGIEKSCADSIDRDAVLTKVETEKRLALIKALEECEKTKADNKAYKKLSTIGAWENSKKAYVEVQLKQIEEKIEKKKAEYAEKMKNKIAGIHKAGEEKRAMVEAKRREDFLKVEETAAKLRASGNTPNKFFGCASANTPNKLFRCFSF